MDSSSLFLHSEDVLCTLTFPEDWVELDETDDEMIHSLSPMLTAKHAPSTPLPPSPSGPGLPVESLLGDPNEREISSPPVRRRKRNMGATSKISGQPVELSHPLSISRSSSLS